jgi:hypothetical protein
MNYYEQQIGATTSDKSEWSSKLYLNLPIYSRIRHQAYTLYMKGTTYQDIKQQLLQLFVNPASIRQAAAELASFKWTHSVGNVEKHVDLFMRILTRIGKDLTFDINGCNPTLDDPITIEHFTRFMPISLRKLITDTHIKFSNWFDTIDALKAAEAEYADINRKFAPTVNVTSDNKMTDISYHHVVDPYSLSSTTPESSATVLHVKTRDTNIPRGGRGRGTRPHHAGSRGGNYKTRNRTIDGTNACAFYLTPKGCYKGSSCSYSHDINVIADAFKNMHLKRSASDDKSL